MGDGPADAGVSGIDEFDRGDGSWVGLAPVEWRSHGKKIPDSKYQTSHSSYLNVHWRPIYGQSAPYRMSRDRYAAAFDVVIERDSEGYYVASVPQLRGCHTQAESLDTLMERIREAVVLCLEVEGDPAASLEFVGIQRITLAA